MLYLETSINTCAWHVGEKFPINSSDLVKEDMFLIRSIQADGDELYYIRDLFTTWKETVTIPLPNLQVVTWFGETAKHIAWALASKCGR